MTASRVDLVLAGEAWEACTRAGLTRYGWLLAGPGGEMLAGVALLLVDAGELVDAAGPLEPDPPPVPFGDADLDDADPADRCAAVAWAAWWTSGRARVRWADLEDRHRLLLLAAFRVAELRGELTEAP